MIGLRSKIVGGTLAALAVTAAVLIVTVVWWPTGSILISSTLPAVQEQRVRDEAVRIAADVADDIKSHPRAASPEEVYQAETLPAAGGTSATLFRTDASGRLDAGRPFDLNGASSPEAIAGCLPSRVIGLEANDPPFPATVGECRAQVLALVPIQAPQAAGGVWLLAVWSERNSLRLAPDPTPGQGLVPILLLEAALLVAVFVALALRWTRRLGRAAADAVRVADAVREGDLTVRMRTTGHDEFGVVARAFNDVLGRLSASVLDLSRTATRQRLFVSDTAHELRTPTAALLASATALEDPATRDEAAVRVAPQLRRLAALTENLLELSRLNAAAAPLVVDEIDLSDLAAEVAHESPGVTATGAPTPVRTDPVRVRGIVANLVANALTHGRPPVRVGVTASGTEAILSVTDAGDGVPDDLRDHVFDRFVRGDPSRHGDGSGLGLAIASESATLLGGSLSLDADGRTFVLRLPLG